jgi:hypothetical protein
MLQWYDTLDALRHRSPHHPMCRGIWSDPGTSVQSRFTPTTLFFSYRHQLSVEKQAPVRLLLKSLTPSYHHSGPRLLDRLVSLEPSPSTHVVNGENQGLPLPHPPSPLPLDLLRLPPCPSRYPLSTPVIYCAWHCQTRGSHVHVLLSALPPRVPLHARHRVQCAI